MTALKSFVSHFINGVYSAVNMHRAANDLTRLSDRELSDIGLSRSDILRLDNKRFTGA